MNKIVMIAIFAIFATTLVYAAIIPVVEASHREEVIEKFSLDLEQNFNNITDDIVTPVPVP